MMAGLCHYDIYGSSDVNHTFCHVQRQMSKFVQKCETLFTVVKFEFL